MVKGNAVYISFDGREDTIRHSFLSHLAAAFHHISISFFACEDPASDDRFSQETDAAISNARVSLVIFSEKFATSKPCLKDLSKVFKCRRSKGLVVVPVFYGITKSELKKQCLKLKNMSPNDLGEDWRHALLEIAELPGHVSSDNRSDSELVEEIVADVRQKLDLKSKIGIYSRLMKMEKLLCKQPWGVRSLGIWGMGGIGKTTLADAAFNQMSTDFDASCFIENFDEAFKEMGGYGLLKEHFGKILMKELDKSNRVTILSLLKEKLRDKRLLLVLDNVHKPLGAANFLGWFDSLGSGSLVVITSRDKQVLFRCRVNEIYEVQSLNEDEALQLFSRSAFGKDVPDQNLLELSMKLVDHANGNPLALSIFGSELEGKTPSQMESVVVKLKRHLPEKIFDVFKSSYDALSDSEKNIFLDIACFFRGENVDNVMQLLAGCGFFARVGIDVLVDKSLVTISENKVQMHNFIHQVGLKIISNQDEEIEMGYRLLDASNSQSLLEENETGDSIATRETDLGNEEDIEAIILDTSNLHFEVHIGLEDMYNLRYLKIYSSHPTKHPGLRLSSGLQSLSSELRLLHWENCPLQSFPQDFDIQHLVELNMPNSKLQKLWEGTKNLEKLKRIRLCNSQQLVNVDGIQYVRNIELIDLQGCSSLQSFPDTSQLQHLEVVNLSVCVEIKSFPKVPLSIRELYLQGTGKLDFVKINDCSHLKTLPEMVTFESLEVLDLSGCSQLEEIQGFPRNLKELYLARTAIKEISSSLYHQHRCKLVILDMQDCKRLRDLPMGLNNMKSLARLKLSGCSKLENIWDLPRNLKELYLTGTAIKEFPSFLLRDLFKLIVLDLENCKKLQHLPMGMSNLKSLVMLKLSGCSDLENICDFPQNLKELYLVGTAIRELPPSLRDLAELDTLDLKNCKRLRRLPMGMQNLNPLKVLDLSNCLELELITSYLPKVIELHLAHTVLSLGAKLPSSFSRFYAHIVTLSLYKAHLESIPEEICWLSSLKKLDLSGNCFQNIPVSIKEFSKLLSLKLHYCNNLRSLPELPRSLQLLNVHGCLSLRSTPLDFEQLPRYYTFSNCFGLSPHMVNEFLAMAMANVEYMEPQLRQELGNALAFYFCLPSCRSRNSTLNLQPGSSVTISLNPYTRSMLVGFAILVEVSFSKDFNDGAGLGFRCFCRWNDKKGHAHILENSFLCWAPGEAVSKNKKDHTFVFCDLKMHPCGSDGSSSEISDDLVVFELFPFSKQEKLVGDGCKITKCGVYVIRCAVGSSAKETEESAMDVELDISPHVGNEKLSSNKKTANLSLSGGGSFQYEIATVQQSAFKSWRPEFPLPTLQASSSKKTSSILAHVLHLSSRNSNIIPGLCQVQGCHKGARGASGRCISHGGGRRCEFFGCTNSAEDRSDFCIAHGGGGQRCSHGVCTRAAKGRSGLCNKHGGEKRCQRVNCIREAEGLSGYCIHHGGGRRCQFIGCTKEAHRSSMFCKAHDGRIQCTHIGCTKSARGKTDFCVRHGGGKRCKIETCRKSARGNTEFCKVHGGRQRYVWSSATAEYAGHSFSAPSNQERREIEDEDMSSVESETESPK